MIATAAAALAVARIEWRELHWGPALPLLQQKIGR